MSKFCLQEVRQLVVRICRQGSPECSFLGRHAKGFSMDCQVVMDVMEEVGS